MRRPLGQRRIVHHADAHAFDVEHLRELQPAVFGTERTPAAAVVAVATDAEHRDAAALFEPVEHVDDVEVAGVQDQVGRAQSRIGVVPERACFRIVRVAQ